MEILEERSHSRSQSGSTEVQLEMSVTRSENNIESMSTNSDRQRLTNDLENEPSLETSDNATHAYTASVAHLGRRFALRQTSRLVQKSGECNVVSVNVTKRKRKYLADGFTTLVELRWRHQILLFATQFVVSWTAFAVVYYLLALARGDIGHYDNGNIANKTWTPCFNNVYDYTSALLYSWETQTTIGYGYRVINSDCHFGVFVVMLQTCIGTFIQALATGVIFAKISRPKGRARTLLFSRSAVICQRDGQYQLLFRVADMRIKSHIIGTSLRALMVKLRTTREGEQIPLCQYPLELDTETSPANDNFVFMVWPVTVVHRINEFSPFWDMSAENCLTDHYEIIVILEGIIESTGSATQFRTSYLPSEIHWGQRMNPLVTFQKENGSYLIDYGQFHNTIPISMPEYSAHVWSLMRETEGSDDRSFTINSEHDYPFQFKAMTSQDRQRSSGRRMSRLRIRSSTKRKQSTAGLSTSTTGSLAKMAPGEVTAPTPTRSAGRFQVWTISDPARPAGSLSRREPLSNFLDVGSNEAVAHSSGCRDKISSNVYADELSGFRKLPKRSQSAKYGNYPEGFY